MRVTELHFPSFSSANAPRRREKRCKNYGGIVAVGEEWDTEKRLPTFVVYSFLLLEFDQNSCFFFLSTVSYFSLCCRSVFFVG